MNIEFSKDIIISGITSFNLEQTLECGQCFRWNKTSENTYHGVAYSKALDISQIDDTVILHNCSKSDFENIWYDYFDLGTDYDTIRKQLAKVHPTLDEAQKYAPGIRILKQEPWEALCSFIISQNNNIPRIKGIINRLCESFGDKVSEYDYSFPTPQDLDNLSVDDLAPLKSGFRAKYIIDACNKINSKEINLDEISAMPIEQAKQELMIIKGVGPKVADCTMLYGMSKKDCFPIDVWIKKAMAVLFPELTPKSFGEYAGIAQQYIFHYSRMHSELFKEK